MSLRSWLARKAVEDELSRIDSGKEGDVLKKAYDYVLRNRAKIGTILGAVSAGLLAYSGDDAATAHQVAGYLGYVVTYLVGSGMHDSDAVKREEQGK